MKIELRKRKYYLDKIIKLIKEYEVTREKRRQIIIDNYNKSWYNKIFRIKFKNEFDLCLVDRFAWEYPNKYYILKSLRSALEAKQTGTIYVDEGEWNLIK